MRRYVLVSSLFCLLFSAAALAQAPEGEPAISDEEPFSDADVVVPKEKVEKDTVTEAVDTESVTLTGELQGQFGYYLSRDFLAGQADFDDSTYTTALLADLLLDVRLRKGFKAFADLGVGYIPQSTPVIHNFIIPPATPFTVTEDTDLVLVLKEIFMDMNISNQIYFRLGKQVLVWGRGYFWNPTDLLNRDKKNFADMEERREGIYGLKVQVPFGTALTLYGFIDATDAAYLSDFAFAGKAEFTIANVEMGLSAWGKKDKVPVFGLDISTSFWDFDVWAEASFSYGDNTEKMSADGLSTYTISDELVTRICAGARKFFDFLDVPDRIMVLLEFYYNQAGYSENMFAKLGSVFLDNYIANNYGQYYGALFFSLSRFIVSDMSLNIKALGNFSDLSFMVFSGISYSPVYNFTLTFDLVGFLGEKNREYTHEGSALGAMLTLSMVF
jgi:hypothetical protein